MTERESGVAEAKHGVAIRLLKNGQSVHNVCHCLLASSGTPLFRQAAGGSIVECQTHAVCFREQRRSSVLLYFRGGGAVRPL
jgi:hypothetical protein